MPFAPALAVRRAAQHGRAFMEQSRQRQRFKSVSQSSLPYRPDARRTPNAGTCTVPLMASRSSCRASTPDHVHTCTGVITVGRMDHFDRRPRKRGVREKYNLQAVSCTFPDHFRGCIGQNMIQYNNTPFGKNKKNGSAAMAKGQTPHFNDSSGLPSR